MNSHSNPLLLVLVALAVLVVTVPTTHAAATVTPAAPSQVAEPPDGAPAAPPPEGAAYTNISPDGSCASGYTAFVIARGVQECYTPDSVVENDNLQGTCPTDPSLFICPGEED
jgi:hypothetical protein